MKIRPFWVILKWNSAGLWLRLDMDKAVFCRLPMTDEQGHSMQGAIVTASSQASITAVQLPDTPVMFSASISIKNKKQRAAQLTEFQRSDILRPLPRQNKSFFKWAVPVLLGQSLVSSWRGKHTIVLKCSGRAKRERETFFASIISEMSLFKCHANNSLLLHID